MDDEDRDVVLGVEVWVRDQEFEITGYASVDDHLPIRGGSGNQRFLRDLPDIRTTDLDECIAILTRYTAALCSYDSVLDDLGVPRTNVPGQS
jgi:hypothetical protein